MQLFSILKDRCVLWTESPSRNPQDFHKVTLTGKLRYSLTILDLIIWQATLRAKFSALIGCLTLGNLQNEMLLWKRLRVFLFLQGN